MTHLCGCKVTTGLLGNKLECVFVCVYVLWGVIRLAEMTRWEVSTKAMSAVSAALGKLPWVFAGL